MQRLLFLIAIVIGVGSVAYSTRFAVTTTSQISFQGDKMSERGSDLISGKTLQERGWWVIKRLGSQRRQQL